MNGVVKKLLNFLGKGQADSGHGAPHSSRSPQMSVLHDGSETATRGQLVQLVMRDLVRKSGLPASWVHCQIQVVNSRSRGQGIFVRLAVKHWDERLMNYAFAFQKALLNDIVQFEPQAAKWLHGIAWQLEVAETCTVTDLPEPSFWLATPPAKTPAQKPLVDPFEITPMPADTAPAHPAAAVAVAAVAVMAAATPAPKTDFLEPLEPLKPLAPLDPLQPLPMILDMPQAAPPDDAAQDLERLFAIRDNELAQQAVNNLIPVGYEATEPAALAK